MSIDKADRHETLRFGPGKPVGLGSNPARQGGVVIFADIPSSARVTIDVSRPVELGEADAGAAGSAGATAPYALELGAPAVPFAVNGVLQTNTRNRVLNAGTLATGLIGKFQAEPTWAAFASPQTGALVQLGRKSHSVDMPGAAAGEGDPAKRKLLRIRWTGTARAAGTFITGDGTTKKFAGQLNVATGDTKIAPGSFRSANFTVAARNLSVWDDGYGRLIGFTRDASTPPNAVDWVDGVIDYLTGEFEVVFSTAPAAGAVAAAYEHTTKYIPLDVYIQWDTLRR
jgi:hypothetical protein